MSGDDAVEPPVAGDAADAAAAADPDEVRRGLDVARDALRAARLAVGREGAGPRPGPRQGGIRRSAPRGGTDEIRSGPGPDDRDPQLLGRSVQRLIQDRGWTTSAAGGAAMTRWAAIVGPTVSEHCRPESFADGRLVVVADSTAWATQVRLLAPTLVRRLNEELGDGSVSVVHVQGPSTPSWVRGRRTVKGRGPRDTYG